MADSTIGDIRTTSAAVGMIIVAIAVSRYRPVITGHGPASPSSTMTWFARYSAAPVSCMAVPSGSMPAIRNIARQSIAR